MTFGGWLGLYSLLFPRETPRKLWGFLQYLLLNCGEFFFFLHLENCLPLWRFFLSSASSPAHKSPPYLFLLLGFDSVIFCVLSTASSLEINSFGKKKKEFVCLFPEKKKIYLSLSATCWISKHKNQEVWNELRQLTVCNCVKMKRIVSGNSHVCRKYMCII